MSASSTPTVRPRAASAAARFAVIDDFPTPPFPLPTAITRVVAAISVGGAACAACHRARCITFERSSWVISSYSTCTSRTPGRPAIFERTSLPIWPRSGQAAVVERDPHGHPAVACDLDPVDHAQIDDRGVQLRIEYAREHASDVVGAGRGGIGVGHWAGFRRAGLRGVGHR